MKKYNKMLKKLKKFIKKEYGIKDMDVGLNDPIIAIAERIVMRSEKCDLGQAYSMWIEDPKLHLPGWISVAIATEICDDISSINQNSTIKELFDANL